MDRSPSTRPIHDLASARCRRSLLRGTPALLLLCCLLSGCTWFRSLVGRCPEKSHQYSELARSAEESGNLAEAVLLLENAIEETPNDPHLHRELARLLLDQNQQDRALIHLKEAVKHNPDDVEANVELAEIYAGVNAPMLAMEHLDSALQNDPKHVTALVLRAELAEWMDDGEAALEMYHRVLGCDPNHLKARARMAALQLKHNRPGLAAPLLRSICHCSHATGEDVAEAQWWLGVAYGQEGRWSDAVESLATASEKREGMSADDWYRLAYARSQLGEWEQVRGDLMRALHINPKHEHALSMLGVFRWEKQSPARDIHRIGHSVKPIPSPEYW